MAMPQENEVQVKVSAETSELRPEMDSSAQDVERTAERMRASMAGLKDAVSGHMATMSTSVKAANDNMAASFSLLEGSFGKVFGVLGAMAAVLGGGAVFQAGVEESKKLTSEANALARAWGISSSEASALSIALGDIYSSSEAAIGASQMLGRQLRTNEEGLNALGLQTRDATGQYRNMRDLMMDSIGVLNQYKEGTDRNLAAQTMFGRGGAEVMAMLKLNNDVLDAAKQKQEELGLIIGVENVEATKAYKAAMNDVDDVMSAIRKSVGDAVMPVLTELGNWFADAGPTAVTVVKGAIGGLVAVFWGLKFAAEAVWNAIAYVIEVATIKVLRMADTMAHALQLDFSGAKAAWERGTEQLEEVADKRLKNVMDSAEETRDKLWNLFSAPTDTGPKEAKGNSYKEPPPKQDKKTAEKTRMPEWEAVLAQKKADYMQSHDMYEMSLEDEKKYWTDLKNTLDKGEKEYGAVRKKAAELELQVLKQKAKEGRELAQEEVAAWSSAATDSISIQQQSAEQQFALGNITKQEMLAQEGTFEQERYEIFRAGVELRMALLAQDPNMNPVEYQKLKDKLLEIDRKHVFDKKATENKVQLDKMAPELNVAKGMESSFATAINGMVMKAQTLRQALGGIFSSIGGTFINEIVAKPTAEIAAGYIRQTALWQALFVKKQAENGAEVAAHAAMETAKTGATVGGEGARVAAEAAGAAAGVGITAAESAGKIAAIAPVAAAGAASSQAAIPVIGPGLAIAAAGAMMAFVMSLGGGSGGNKSTTTTGTPINMGMGSGYTPASVPSAEGGWDIPAGATGLMRYHEREMMLPAKYADTIRNMAEGGGGSGGDGGNHFHFHGPSDASSFQRWLKTNSHAAAPALRQLARNFTSTRG